MSSVIEQTQSVDTTSNLIEELRELESTREGLQVLIGQAQSELDDAKAKQKITGEYADADWFAKTRAVVREETVELHNTNRRIKTIRSQLSKSNPKASFFQQAAKKILDEKTYDEINTLANQWLKD